MNLGQRPKILRSNKSNDVFLVFNFELIINTLGHVKFKRPIPESLKKNYILPPFQSLSNQTFFCSYAVLFLEIRISLGDNKW